MRKYLIILFTFLALSASGQSLIRVDGGLLSITQGETGLISIIPLPHIPIPNGGAEGATDWLNTTNGLAQYFTLSAGLNTPASIITGVGFTGNAQRVDTDGFNVIELISDLFNIESGDNYKLSFEYTSSSPSILSHIYIRDSGASITDLGQLTINTGNSINYLSAQFSIIDTQIDVDVWFSNSGSAQYLEIDEIKLIKQ